MSNRMSGARYIAESVKAHGIEHVFYMEGILRRTMVEMDKVGINRVLTHSEKSAAYMADGYARAGNRPGLCLAQSVGAANLAAGLQDAYLGQVPVIAFTGRKPPIFQYRNAYQEILHNRLFDPVTKFNAEVTSADQIPFLLAQAVKDAVTGTPRPTHLDFLGYMGDTSENDETELPLAAPDSFNRLPARRPVPESRDVHASAEAITRSERPCIVVGRGAIVSEAHQAVSDLAEKIGAAVAYSVDAKEIMTDEHPLLAGPVGTYCRPCANRIVAEADLVVFVGCDTGDQVTKNWTLPGPLTPVVQIDPDPSEIGRSYPNAIGIMGDSRTAVQMLNDAVQASDRGGWRDRIRSLVSEWRDSVKAGCESDATPIRTERLCSEITEWLPENVVVAADTGFSAIWAAQLINLRYPDQKFIRASGSLGWAYPASLGAKCALPDRPVVCFTGDGAFWYHLAEMETALRWNIPTVTVINNNSTLGQSKPGILRTYGSQKGRAEQQYRFLHTDFASVANAVGAIGIRVEKPGLIRPALDEALACGKPAVVDVVTDPESLPVVS